MWQMKFSFINISYRFKLLYIISAFIIGLSSLLFTNYIVGQFASQERKEMQLWSMAMGKLNNVNKGDAYFNKDLNDLVREIINRNTTIPTIIIDEKYNIIDHRNVTPRIFSDQKVLFANIEKMVASNEPIIVDTFNNNRYYIFYSESQILSMLRYFPYVQLGVITIFILLVFITFRSSKEDEQKRVWIGMAKETAHQLGTPTSSLLGWLEYLKEQKGVERFVIDEMNNDITRLLKVVDRFSKIGSKTILSPKNIYELVGNTVNYFRLRLPRNVELVYDKSASGLMPAMVNEALFEWVIENLLKNSLDALNGKGVISISVYDDAKWVYIDVRDTGKGIHKSKHSAIFNPGYTTKSRGWGLGLSLSKRIVSEYHNGRIFVAESEVDKGTTIRIMIKKL